jgi:hypothetical protein
MERTALRVAAVVFALVALGHFSRLVFRFGIVVGGWDVPLWLNGVGGAIAAALALWMWKAQVADRTLTPPWER